MSMSYNAEVALVIVRCMSFKTGFMGGHVVSRGFNMSLPQYWVIVELGEDVLGKWFENPWHNLTHL